MVKIVNNTSFTDFEDYKNQALDAAYPSYINPDYRPFESLVIDGQDRANQITFEQLFDPNFETLFPGTITELEVRHDTRYEFYTLNDYSITLEADSESVVLSGSVNSTGQLFNFYPPEEDFKSKVVGTRYPSDLVFEKSFKGGAYRRQSNSSAIYFYEVLNSPHLKDVHTWLSGGRYIARRHYYNLRIGSEGFAAFSRGFIGENNQPYSIVSGSTATYFGIELVISENPSNRIERIDGINSGELFFTPSSPLKNVEISGDYGGLDDGFGEFYSNLLIPVGATATFYDERIRSEKPLIIESSSGITTSYDDFGNLSITNNDDAETGYLKLYKKESSPDPGGSDSDEEWWAMIQSSGVLK